MPEKPFYEKYFLAVCEDGDDPVFYCNVYFLNDTDETVSIAVGTNAFATDEGQVYQTPVAENTGEEIGPRGHVVLESLDNGAFDYWTDYEVQVTAPSGNEKLSFSIPKYLGVSSDAVYIPLLKKKGCLIEEGGPWKRDKETLARCDEALEKNPQSKRAWVAKGLCFTTSYDWDRAIDCFDEALRIDPAYAQAWCEKACALDRPGLSSRQAVKCFEKALQIKPTCRRARAGRAEAIEHLAWEEEHSTK